MANNLYVPAEHGPDVATRERALAHRESIYVVVERIVSDMDLLREMILTALIEKHHVALNYGDAGWGGYVADIFRGQGRNLGSDDKRNLVIDLASLQDDEGRVMSTTALGSVVGTASATVRRMLGTEACAERKENVVGINGGLHRAGHSTATPAQRDAKKAVSDLRSRAGALTGAWGKVSLDIDARAILIDGAKEMRDKLNAFLAEHDHIIIDHND